MNDLRFVFRQELLKQMAGELGPEHYGEERRETKAGVIVERG